MIKTAIIAGTILGLAHGTAAVAGPYVNVESNSGFAGSDYTGGLLESHVGYEGGGEGTSWYVQSGPALVLTDGADSEVELSGKVGGSVEVAANTDVYGEVSFITGDTNGYGLKTGVKYRF